MSFALPCLTRTEKMASRKLRRWYCTGTPTSRALTGSRKRAVTLTVGVRGDVSRPEDCARLCVGTKGAVVFHTAGIIHPRRTADFYVVNVEAIVKSFTCSPR